MPLSIIYAKKPFKKIAPEQGIDELFVGGRENANLHLRWDRKQLVSWRNFFLLLRTAWRTGSSGCISVRCARWR